MLYNTSTPKNQIDEINPSVNYKLTNVYKQSKHSPENTPQLPSDWQDNATPLDYYFDYDDCADYSAPQEAHEYFNQGINPESLDTSHQAPEKVEISKLYLDDEITKIINNSLEKNINVKSLYGTGKTTSLKLWDADFKATHGRKANILYVTAGRKLNASAAIGLDLNYYENVLIAPYFEQPDLAKRATVTDQSIHKIAKFGVEYDLVIFDESEQTIADIVSKINENKSETIAAFKSVINKATHVLWMDAGLGANTKCLQKLLNISPTTLFNSFSPWEGIETVVITGRKFKGRIETVYEMIIGDTNKGRRIYVACGSKAQAEKVAELISLKTGIKQIVFTGDTADKKEQTDIINNPEKIDNYQALVGNTVIGTGISFDSNPFDVVYGVFSNNEGTATPDIAAQQITRCRKVKKFVIALDDDKSVYSSVNELLNDNDIFDAFYKLVWGEELAENELELLKLFSKIEANKRNAKDNFNKIFINKLKEMKLDIHTLDISKEAITTNNSSTVNNAMKAKKFEEQKRIANADKIDCEEQKALKEIRRIGCTETGEKLTDSGLEAISLKLERYHYEDAMCCNFDDMTQEERTEVFKNKDKYLSKARRRGIANALQTFDKKYIANTLSKLDVVDEKQTYLLDKKIHSFAKRFIKKGYFTEKELFKSANGAPSGFYKYITKNKKTINLLFNKMINSDFEKKPSKLMRKLLNNLGYLTYINKKEQRIDIKQDAKLEAFIERQAAENKDWITFTSLNMREIKKQDKAMTHVVNSSEHSRRGKEELNAYLRDEISLICNLANVAYLAPHQAQPIAKLITENKRQYQALNVRHYLTENSLDSLIKLASDSL